MAKKTLKISELSAEDHVKTVAALLKSKPDILEKHPELLTQLEFSDPKEGNITSLASRQSDQLKTQIIEMREKTQQLVKNAQHYDTLTNNIYSIINELVACDDLAEATQTIIDKTPDLFGIDFINITTKLDMPSVTDASVIFNKNIIDDEAYSHVAERISQGKCLCSDRFPQSVLTYFFNTNAEAVHSAAFIPLIGKSNDPKDIFGVLAFGSTDKTKFASKLKGTVHLERLGKVTALTIERIYK